MEVIDFYKEIASHVIWNVKLKCFLDGGECIPEKETVDSRECELGKWLYTEGINKYGMLPEMLELEKTHDQLHEIIKRVVQKKNSGDNYRAELELTKMKSVSNRVVELLLHMEERTRTPIN